MPSQRTLSDSEYQEQLVSLGLIYAGPVVCMTRLLAVALVFLLVHDRAAAQDRGNRAAQRTHDFLGLGRTPDPAAAARGAQLFEANCSFCHGAKATGGDTGPDLVRSSVVLHDENGEMIGPVIHGGRQRAGMPAFAAFSDAELRDLSEFLHSRVELTANRGTYQVEEIKGDSAAGRAYFNGPGKCNSCHSTSPLTSGDLAHIGARLSAAELQNTFLYPAARNEPAPAATVTLADGRTLTGKLKQLDDFSLTICPEHGSCQTFAKNTIKHFEVDDKLAAHRALLGQYTDAEIHNLTAYLQTLK